jgi:hypothetical protein
VLPVGRMRRSNDDTHTVTHRRDLPVLILCDLQRTRSKPLGEGLHHILPKVLPQGSRLVLSQPPSYPYTGHETGQTD